MKTITLLFMLACGAAAQVNGQTAASGETAPFSIKLVKDAAPIPLTAIPGCVGVKDSNGAYHVIAGRGIDCTITLNKAAPASGATATMTYTDPNFTGPATVTFAPGSFSAIVRIMATP